jgi:hypothetical protein
MRMEPFWVEEDPSSNPKELFFIMVLVIVFLPTLLDPYIMNP